MEKSFYIKGIHIDNKMHWEKGYKILFCEQWSPTRRDHGPSLKCNKGSPIILHWSIHICNKMHWRVGYMSLFCKQKSPKIIVFQFILLLNRGGSKVFIVFQITCKWLQVEKACISVVSCLSEIDIWKLEQQGK